jgi:DNA replication licensing factor MCM4
MRFKRFVQGCSVGGVRRYLDMLKQVHMTGNTSFSLDCNHLARFDMELYRDMVLDEMFRELLAQEGEEYELEEQIKVRPFRLLNKRPMRELNPSDMNSLVSIQGMVTRASQCIPDLKQAFYQVFETFQKKCFTV